jgi:hypothetical protein
LDDTTLIDMLRAQFRGRTLRVRLISVKQH